MTARSVVLALVLVVVAAAVGVGAAAPTDTPTPTPTAAEPETLGAQVSSFMAASVAQTDGSVENGMWVAAYENASDNATRRALVQSRVGSLNATIQSLQAERQALIVGYQNGTLDRTQFQARMANVVGQLAALGESIEAADERGRAVGVNATRLETLRTQARELGGGAVSAVARNLTGPRSPPGQPGLFGGDHPGRSNKTGPGGPPTDRQTGPPTDREPGPPNDSETDQPAGNATASEGPAAAEDA